MIARKEFREDLYYRMRGVQLRIPSLKERVEDIPLLAEAFLSHAVALSNKKISGFSPESIELMKIYEWPGNIRQLKNEIERMVALTENDSIQPEDFDIAIQSALKSKMQKSPATSLREMEKAAIADRLAEHKWNVATAARSLGLSRHGLYSKMKRYRLRVPSTPRKKR